MNEQQFGINELLEKFRKVSSSNREKGTRFEDLIKKYFLTDPLFASQLKEVWTWIEFPHRNGKPDTGIDLVALTKDTNEYWAIQCKFYLPEHTISKPDVDTFLATSGKSFDVEGKPRTYAKRIIISTTDSWNKNAEDAIINQIIPVTRIDLQSLLDSSINWEKFDPESIESISLISKNKLWPHQEDALKAVREGFNSFKRGKMIMACGTGKTFASLKIVEDITKGTGVVAFFAPSIALVNQTITEWAAQIDYDSRYIVICSDSTASKFNANYDRNQENSINAIYPATTDLESVKLQFNTYSKLKKQVIFFSTYQSIDVLIQLQKTIHFEFDIIICDEAHRTTGATLSGEDDSNFVKVHYDDNIKTKKRLYMTATPRIYGENVKKKAEDNDAILCSMDDEALYGPEFYKLGFSEAVSKDLLSDYKVLILAVDENYVNKTYQKILSSSNNELNLDDSTKIVGCWNGLSKKTLPSQENEFATDSSPMRRAVAFCNTIDYSKKVAAMFKLIETEYRENNGDDDMVKLEAQHVDGSYSALKKKEKIDWLKHGGEGNTCRILTNARCLSEGVDVPALDSVMFLAPRNSIVDIVQSVGRVMRKKPGKKYGYIILPIGIPVGVKPEEALQDNEKYRVVWDVLQALRAHDDRFNNTINKIDLNKNKPDNINVIGVGFANDDEARDNLGGYEQLKLLSLEELDDWKDSIYAKIVQKCGSRRYWESWAKDVAQIAQRHVDRINQLLENNDESIKDVFKGFVESLRNNLNKSITAKDAIDMLAQHIITKPVFDALFDDYEFVQNNPVSRAMQNMIDLLDKQSLEKERETLQSFYLSVRERAAGIDNSEGKQKIIIELYDKFFKTALPKQVEKLGIVYTPIEIVDFIINSVEKELNKEFKVSLSDEHVHILDPFTGTGTFIVRLLQSGIIRKEDLLFKYANEIHANEIVLLAYYIAAINIEEAFHEIYGKDKYIPFEGIVLTDTFQLSEATYGNKIQRKINEQILPQNSERAQKQLKQDIKVIIANPPYSVGQKSENDNNQNYKYEFLDASIASTYVKFSNAKLKNKLYDSYIRAFRWASNRIGKNDGIICYVSNGAYIDNAAMDGFRQCLLNEFTSIYCFNLRGNCRTSGELRRKESGNVFGEGSRTPIAITLLVKNSSRKNDKFIHYYDIGDYLTRPQKFEVIRKFKDVNTIKWTIIQPDENNDWINKSTSEFKDYIGLSGDERFKAFTISSQGIISSRDKWVYNFSQPVLGKIISSMITFYTSERIRLLKAMKFNSSIDINSFVNSDSKHISWSHNLKNSLLNKDIVFDESNIVKVMYRPFCIQYLYFDKDLLERPSSNASLAPTKDFDNLIMSVSTGNKKGEFVAFVSKYIVDYHLLNNSTQEFSLKYKMDAARDKVQLSLFEDEKKDIICDNITIDILNECRGAYGTKFTKEDVFYYIYGILHSKEYLSKFATDLLKSTPRIPLVKQFATFSSFGKQLANLHLNYETGPAAKVKVDIKRNIFKVKKMHFAKVGGKEDKTTILFNEYITISEIPLEAYEYIINGKSVIDWVMERYAVIEDSETGIVNDPNLFSEDEKYVLNLLLSLISISLETIKIVKQLPAIELLENN